MTPIEALTAFTAGFMIARIWNCVKRASFYSGPDWRYGVVSGLSEWLGNAMRYYDPYLGEPRNRTLTWL